MNIKKYTLSIGIPVYNEESNIQRLLKSLYSQTSEKIRIKEIIVSSDGSSDKTVAKVRSFSNSYIKLRVIDNKNRKGIARGLNQIINKCSSDILVTLDGDIQITDKYFIEKLVSPIFIGNADLTSSTTAELPPVSKVAKALFVSMKLKRILFNSFSNGNNLYTCFGLARGYSKRFYKKLNFKVSIGNDMYSYLSCLSFGFNFIHSKEAVAYYRLPETFIDHEKQSTRFLASPQELTKHFGDTLLNKETKIPFISIIKTIFTAIPTILKSPLDLLYYMWIQLNVRKRRPTYSINQAWDIATTSKHL